MTSIKEISNPRCPMCNNRDPSQIVGIEIPGVYDGFLFWTCAHCGWTFHRFPYNGHFRRLRRLADPFVAEANRDEWLTSEGIDLLPDPEVIEGPAEAGPS